MEPLAIAHAIEDPTLSLMDQMQLRWMLLSQMYAAITIQSALSTGCSGVYVFFNAPMHYTWDTPYGLGTLSFVFVGTLAGFYNVHGYKEIYPKNLYFLVGLTIASAVLVGAVSASLVGHFIFIALLSFTVSALGLLLYTLLVMRPPYQFTVKTPLIISALLAMSVVSIYHVLVSFGSFSTLIWGYLVAVASLGGVISKSNCLVMEYQPNELVCCVLSIFVDRINQLISAFQNSTPAIKAGENAGGKAGEKAGENAGEKQVKL